MKKILMLASAALLVGFAPISFAQEAPVAGTPTEELPEVKIKGTGSGTQSTEVDRADHARRTPTIEIVKTGPDGPPPATDIPEPEEQIDEPPPAEVDSDPTSEDDTPPDFFGEPVEGSFCFVLDRSGSMGAQDSGSGPIEDSNGGIISNPNRIQIVKAETIKVLDRLRESDEFAILSFGASPEQRYYEALVAATPGNVDTAKADILALVASGWTPAYSALRNSCTKYGNDLDKIYFLCDGSPNQDAGAPNGNGSSGVILGEFPQWFAPLKDAGCTMVCVHIGNSGAAQQFMQSLAQISGGVYIHK